MFERLINLERPRGEPDYGKRAEEIAWLKDSLCGQLDREGQEWLERLADAYLRQEDIVLRDAFSDGFWTAVTLAQEFEGWKRDISAIAPPD